MASAVPLTEPQVLAHTKDRLFHDSAESNAYAVCDTQFATDTWLPGQPITSEIRERLAPFNHVRIGSGYPDLVGVGTLEDDLLAVERFGDHPPLIAIEAKGYTGTETVDVERGILQASIGFTRRTLHTLPHRTQPSADRRGRSPVNSTSASSV